MKIPRLLRPLGLVLCTLFLIALLAFAWVWSRVQSSLPPLDGEHALPGLTASTVLTRDDQGIVAIEAANFPDAVRALGFAHGQDRFFQMDLLRRRAGGRLSELFGEATVDEDRANIVHRFAAQAEKVLEREPAARRALFDAYAAGVNAGLQSLEASPWEYGILRGEPEPWTALDSVLVTYAMVIDLQDTHGEVERSRTDLRDALGVGAVDFFDPLIGPDDSALDGSTAPLPPPPSPERLDLRTVNAALASEHTAAQPLPETPALGSNAFALGGVLAGDPHLTLRVPNAWYRAHLTWKTPAGADRFATGVSLPGLPGILIGSNGHIAWTFTNATVDLGDLVLLDLNHVAPELLYYRAGESLEFETHTDTIAVKGEDAVTVDSTWTAYGPVVGKTRDGRTLTHRWTFHDPTAVDYTLLDMLEATSVAAALDIGAAAGMPPQNLFVTDASGAAGWTVTGRLPKRFGFDGRFPVTWTYGDRGWDGWLDAAQHPRRLVSAESSRQQPLWSGNQRPVGGDALALLGDSGFDDPARAAQIERNLRALAAGNSAPLAPADLLAIQLDDRADWMLRWREQLLASFARAASPLSPERTQFRDLVAAWDGRAAADSVGYRLLRTWRSAVARRTLDPIFARVRRARPEFNFGLLRYEAALWALHRDEPAHLVANDYGSWDALRLAAVDQVIAEWDDAGLALNTATWGEANRLRMQHPLGGALPEIISEWLNMPALPQSGDLQIPRVARPYHGASLRFAVVPGKETDGLLHLPGGQSGNPLSPFYRAGHQAWARGEPAPLLPGDPIHTLTLTP